MYERKLYRPCPMCRTQLEDNTAKIAMGEDYKEWEAYECPNCGSAIYIRPFIRMIETRQG